MGHSAPISLSLGVREYAENNLPNPSFKIDTMMCGEEPPLYIREEDYYENLKRVYGEENVFKVGEGHYQISKRVPPDILDEDVEIIIDD